MKEFATYVQLNAQNKVPHFLSKALEKKNREEIKYIYIFHSSSTPVFLLS